MTAFIISATVILALAGIAVSIWSLINTRKKHYEEYMIRKKND